MGFGGDRSFQPLLAAIHRAGTGDLATAGRLGDTAIHRQVRQLQAVHAVVGGQRQAVELVGHAQGDPLIPAAAQGGGRAGLVGDAAVAAAKDKDLDELVEDDSVRDAGAVAAQRVAVVAGGQQRGELVPQGFLDAGWDRRHETSR
jgi:hypothetical protein